MAFACCEVGVIKKALDGKIVGLGRGKAFSEEYRDFVICFLLFSNPRCIRRFAFETLSLSGL